MQNRKEALKEQQKANKQRRKDPSTAFYRQKSQVQQQKSEASAHLF